MTDQTQSVSMNATTKPPHTVRLAHAEILFDDSLADVAAPADWFDPQNPALDAQPVTQGGRAAAWYIRLGTTLAVLRHYRRGGWARRILRDQYLWLGASRTRAFAEFAMMRGLWLSGLPVPQPLAAAVWRRGWIYRAALVTARITQATALARVTEHSVWFEAGRVIAQLHHAGVWHADLNVFNLLVDAQSKVWLIDFDRARQGRMTQAQRAENLARLLRSLRKVTPESEENCWPALLQGYQHEANILNNATTNNTATKEQA
jgi:3-deoxy-D-manno-octulosonic acid kinase